MYQEEAQSSADMLNPHKLLIIKHGTIPTNVAILGILDSHSTQLGNSSDEIFLENVGAGSEGINGRLGPWVRKEDLIGGKEALALLKILVVHVVECARSGGVHVDGDPRVHVLGAHGLEGLCVFLVESGVHGVFMAVIVHSIGELVAVGESKGVSSCHKPRSPSDSMCMFFIGFDYAFTVFHFFLFSLVLFCMCMHSLLIHFNHLIHDIQILSLKKKEVKLR